MQHDVLLKGGGKCTWIILGLHLLITHFTETPLRIKPSLFHYQRNECLHIIRYLIKSTKMYICVKPPGVQIL